jgi:hypothetical protein
MNILKFKNFLSEKMEVTKSRFSELEIKGAGDLVAKITKVTKIDLAIKKVTQTIGIQDCGCKERREILNNLIPFKSSKL